MNNVEARIMKVISGLLEVEPDRIHAQSSFVEDLNADSMDTVELVMAFEEEFEIAISDDQAERISTVQDVIDLVSAEQAA